MSHKYTKARLTCYKELGEALEQSGISLLALVRCALDEFLEDFPNLRALYHEHGLRTTVSKRVLRQLERELAERVDAAKLARQLRRLASFGDAIPPMEYVRKRARYERKPS